MTKGREINIGHVKRFLTVAVEGERANCSFLLQPYMSAAQRSYAATPARCGDFAEGQLLSDNGANNIGCTYTGGTAFHSAADAAPSPRDDDRFGPEISTRPRLHG